ncbi:hypothetical protein HY991_00990 [Candidatus Micrarchaeota archaeon]|nr:hypothetical protein [Candidatus Micrarchaeota archaeon]
MRRMRFKEFLTGFLMGALVLSLGWASSLLLSPTVHQQACIENAIAIFSPPAERELVEALGSARESIDAELFEFSSLALKQALVKAAGKGVKVRVLLEPRVDYNIQTASYLKAHGISVKWASREFAYTHSKFAVLDGKKLLVGSINWSRSALTKNREAEVLVESISLAKRFLQVFEDDWKKGSEVTG